MKRMQSNIRTVGFSEQQSQDALLTLNDRLVTFKQLLERERSLMEERSVDQLPVLLAEKEQVLADLLSLESFMVELFSSHADHPSVVQLKQALMHCRELNRRNQSTASIELRAARESMELLRSLQKMNDLPLYSAAGTINVLREKRDLGQA